MCLRSRRPFQLKSCKLLFTSVGMMLRHIWGVPQVSALLDAPDWLAEEWPLLASTPRLASPDASRCSVKLQPMQRALVLRSVHCQTGILIVVQLPNRARVTYSERDPRAASGSCWCLRFMDTTLSARPPYGCEQVQRCADDYAGPC